MSKCIIPVGKRKKKKGPLFLAKYQNNQKEPAN
jgi:hypothetical protein